VVVCGVPVAGGYRHGGRLNLTIGRIDDIPLLLARLERMSLQPLLDEHFVTHGNWVGLSLGWVTVLWLTHILSEGDHQLNHVVPWAKQRLHTLRDGTGQPVHPVGRERRTAGNRAGGLERRYGLERL
jgi:hypothetical protein